MPQPSAQCEGDANPRLTRPGGQVIEREGDIASLPDIAHADPYDH
jgi:hypothetical protein